MKLLLAVFLIGLIGSFVVPLQIDNLTSTANPIEDFELATAKFTEIRDHESGLDLMPECASLAMAHEQRKVERVIVLIHGLTNCPRQFLELGEQLFERGFNVLIPRLPQHGFRTRDLNFLNDLRAEQLRDYADEVIDTAAGYGEQIYVLGLSAGGTIAAWIAQHREVERALILSPFIGLSGVSETSLSILMNGLRRMPPITTINPNKTNPHTYPGDATWGVAESLRFARAVFVEAKHSAPMANSVVIAIIPDDPVVSNEMTHDLFEFWAEKQEGIDWYSFPSELNLEHDFIDVANPNGQPIEETYPILIDLVEGIIRPSS